MAAGRTFHKRFLINSLPSANVDKDSGPFHAVDCCRVHKLLGLVSVWQGCHYVVALSHELVQLVWCVDLHATIVPMLL